MRQHRQRSEKLKRCILGLVVAFGDVNEDPVIHNIFTCEDTGECSEQWAESYWLIFKRKKRRS